MIVEINFNNNTVNGQQFDDKNLKNTISMCILGKPVKQADGTIKRMPAKNIDGFEFNRTPKTFNNIKCPTFKRDQLDFLSMALANGYSIKANGKDIEWFEFLQLQDEIAEFIESKENADIAQHNLLQIIRDDELRKMYNLGLSKGKGLELVDAYLDSYIRNSGYDVSLSSATTVEGHIVYKFRDNMGKMVEGCVPVTKKFEQFSTTLADKLTLYNQVKFYQSIGIEPELPKEKHDMLGRYGTAIGVSEEDIELFIQNELNKDEAEDSYICFLSNSPASVQMRLS